MRQTAKLTEIHGKCTITRESEFWHLFQRGLLLELKEQGILNDPQFRRAEEILSKKKPSWERP